LETIERVRLVNALTRRLARYRISDVQGLLPDYVIESLVVTDDDRAFALQFLREAAPLYPLPGMIDEEATI
jgi:hypothetical protein